MDAILQSVIERIERTVAEYERSGEVPDRFANDYLAHALTCLSGAQYAEAHEHLLAGIKEASSEDGPWLHEPHTVAEHRARFEEIKAALAD